MTTTSDKIKVMQAFERGEDIEALNHNAPSCGWFAIDVPTWSWDKYNYRIKPEPKTIWVNEYDDGFTPDLMAYRTKPQADDYADKERPRHIAVEYREVIKESK
jgi:hypothetical protein